MRSPTDSVALVTGASRGLGFAVAQALGACGTHVIALARTVGGLEELATQIEAAGGTSTLVPLDITDEDGLRRMCRAIHNRWGQLDLLVHCAIHATPLAPANAIGEKDLDRAIAVNLRASQRLIALADPLLKASPNARVIVPRDAHAGDKFYASYGMTKTAQQALVDSYAAESLQIGPRVLSFTPEPMPTALRARFFPGEDRDKLSSPATEAARLLKLLD